MGNLSYILWILIFLVVPIALMWLRFHQLLARFMHVYLINGALVSLGLIWDSWGSQHRLWVFPATGHIGRTIYYLPVEEYLAFGLLITFMITSFTIIVFTYSVAAK